MARRGEIRFRRYQVRIDEATLARLGIRGGRVPLPIALDRVDAVDFLHEVGRRFAASIDWSDERGLYPAGPADPFEDPGLWRTRAPKPRSLRRAEKKPRSARLP